jgi:hypothetical protein
VKQGSAPRHREPTPRSAVRSRPQPPTRRPGALPVSSARASACRSAISSSASLRPGATSTNSPRIRSAARRRAPVTQVSPLAPRPAGTRRPSGADVCAVTSLAAPPGRLPRSGS